MKPFCCQVLINGDLEIPCHKPPAEQIILAIVEPVVDRVIVIENKVIVRGHLDIRIEYVADVNDCSQPVHFVHYAIQYNCLIDYPCLKDCTEVRVFPEIEYKEFCLVDKRTISKLIVVKICVERKHEEPVNNYHPKFPCFGSFPARSRAFQRFLFF
ncbi:MAG: DUF3794 domain-containing protein [Desulfotomaculaceae bacterium]